MSVEKRQKSQKDISDLGRNSWNWERSPQSYLSRSSVIEPTVFWVDGVKRGSWSHRWAGHQVMVERFQGACWESCFIKAGCGGEKLTSTAECVKVTATEAAEKPPDGLGLRGRPLLLGTRPEPNQPSLGLRLWIQKEYLKKRKCLHCHRTQTQTHKQERWNHFSTVRLRHTKTFFLEKLANMQMWASVNHHVPLEVYGGMLSASTLPYARIFYIFLFFIIQMCFRHFWGINYMYFKMAAMW